MAEGIFSQHGPEGIFNAGQGPPADASNPIIDSDGTPLREVLEVAFPSPGHMRVARALRHPTSGKTEYQEQFREPSPEEVEWLRRSGVTVGQGSMVQSRQVPSVGDTGPGIAPNVAAPAPNGVAPNAQAPAANGQPQKSGFGWLGVLAAFAAGGAALYVGGKYVMPKIEEWMGSQPADDDDVDDED